MTYGVDQCRCCGVAIKPRRPTEYQEYLASLKAKPTMSEAEWRRRGFLAMPTQQQVHQVQYGCCQPCGERLIRQKMGAFRRLAKVVVGGGIAFAVIWIVALYITH